MLARLFVSPPAAGGGHPHTRGEGERRGGGRLGLQGRQALHEQGAPVTRQGGGLSRQPADALMENLSF